MHLVAESRVHGYFECSAITGVGVGELLDVWWMPCFILPRKDLNFAAICLLLGDGQASAKDIILFCDDMCTILREGFLSFNELNIYFYFAHCY